MLHFVFEDAWNWTMTWLDMAPRPGMVALLEKQFFPRWHQVLHSWITSAPNYDEITKWYTGWKSMFPEGLINDPAIKGTFFKINEIALFFKYEVYTCIKKISV